MDKLNSLKNEILSAGDGECLDLLKALEEKESERFTLWLEKPSSIELFDMAEKYKRTNLYSHRTGPLPYFNDVSAIDSASLKMWGGE